LFETISNVKVGTITELDKTEPSSLLDDVPPPYKSKS
jgi:hypothetical protein